MQPTPGAVCTSAPGEGRAGSPSGLTVLAPSARHGAGRDVGTMDGFSEKLQGGYYEAADDSEGELLKS